MAKKPAEIADLDFAFEHKNAKIIANRNNPEILLAGLRIGPFEEGNTYETYYWVATELERFGIARFHEDENINLPKLNKVQWTERIQTAGQMSRLPEDFYPKLRRFMSNLKEETSKAPEKLPEKEKAKHLTRDIVNSRLRKIVSIASAPDQTEQTLKNLTQEERELYDHLHTLITDWRIQILEYGEGEEE